MRCPYCQKENEPTNRFCIFCSSPLSVSQAGRSPQSAPESEDTVHPRPQNLEGELRQLRELVTVINDRLAALERLSGVAVPQPIPTSAPPPSPTPKPQPIIQPVPPSLVEAKPARVREWEQILGGNWLARIGVVALIIGVAFFLKFAFDNNWLGPTARIILGVIAGLAMVGAGYYWRSRYPTLAQAITGGGIAVLYLSIFAAFATYHLVSLYPAIVFLLLVSAGSAILALRHNSMTLAIIGIFGAFSAPFILGSTMTGGSSLSGAGSQLLVYIMVIDLGVIALSTFRNWRWFTLLALIGSLAAFELWYAWFGTESTLLLSEGSLTIIFLIFVGATALYHLRWHRACQGFDYALMVINATAYFGISCGLMWADLPEWMGGFSLLLALFYGGLAYVALRRGVETVRLAFFALGIALVLLTIAIPIQLGDKAWTTIAWAAEGATLAWLSFHLRMPQLRGYSYAAFAATAVRLMFFDSTLELSAYRPVLNERVLTFLTSIATLYFASYFILRQRGTPPTGEKTAWSISPILLGAANFFTIWLLSAEVWGYFSKQLAALSAVGTEPAASDLRSARNLSLTALWAVYAVIVLVVGIAKRSWLVRLGALVLLAIPIVKVFVYDVFALEQVYRIIAFVGLGILLLSGGYLYQRYSKTIRGLLLKE